MLLLTNWIQSCLTKESRDRVCFETEICPRPRSTGTVIKPTDVYHTLRMKHIRGWNHIIPQELIGPQSWCNVIRRTQPEGKTNGGLYATTVLTEFYVIKSLEILGIVLWIYLKLVRIIGELFWITLMALNLGFCKDLGRNCSWSDKPCSRKQID